MESITQLMLALLRGSLNGCQPDRLPAGEEEWEKVYWLARSHGVVTMINDAIERLPADRQPHGDIALSWALSADRTRHHYRQQVAVFETLRQRAAQAGLGLLVIKGLALSPYYPIPSSRPCGDIDILFLPASEESYRRGNRLLGVSDTHLNGKHTETTLEGVTIENHLYFLDRNYRSQLRAERYIRSTLSDTTADGRLSPMGNMVYLLMHTVSHLTAKYKLPLRNILDWGMFLHANRDSLDPAACRRVMRNIGMEDAFHILTLLAGEFTGRELGCFLSKKMRQDDIAKMRSLILEKKYLEAIPAGLGPLQRFGVRLRRNRQQRWLYRYLPSTPLERTRYHIRNLIHKKRG